MKVRFRADPVVLLPSPAKEEPANGVDELRGSNGKTFLRRFGLKFTSKNALDKIAIKQDKVKKFMKFSLRIKLPPHTFSETLLALKNFHKGY